ncbi:hypothetical protein KIW84_041158 [Lathyrus oleraceus]|uniref:Uncharacterized protein n=1 Tax=Pisum sativum TaxID=3888 RepID=A0A9D4XBY3_PEA|nr:hypothetical protein KIW84_041158 [Pisum sativum]
MIQLLLHGHQQTIVSHYILQLLSNQFLVLCTQLQLQSTSGNFLPWKGKWIQLQAEYLNSSFIPVKSSPMGNLNHWQSENMVSQNEILQSLDKRVDKIAEKIDKTDDNLKVLSQKMQKHYRSLKAQVSQLDRDLRQMLEERTFGKTFDQKEREIRNLQGQVKEIDDFLRASHERKPKPVENSFFDPHAFPIYFKQPERPSPFYPTYASSPPDQNIPETPPPKIQKEEETPDKGFQAMAITRKYEPPQENHHLAETSAHKEDESSIDSDNNSDQETSTDETPGSVSSKSESEDNYIPRLFMANIKEEDSFFEEESP